jgi:DNA modification methylase
VNSTILHGDCVEVMKALPEASIDAVVTDPPYGIGFMGKEWDTFKPGVEAKRIVANRAIESDNPNLKGRTRGPASSPSAVEYDYSLKGLRSFQVWTEGWAREVFRVLKPGGHIVVCGAPRAYHRMASGLEDAGFEIRDCLAWLFGSGFPKSLNLGEGLGTALKPAHEPIVLARKPFKGTVKGNVAKFGTGALNIDACRIEGLKPDMRAIPKATNPAIFQTSSATNTGEMSDEGRWPANVVIDDLAAMVIDEQSGELTSGFMAAGTKREGIGYHGGLGDTVRNDTHADSGGASRFYYCAKPSREERDMGCHGLQARSGGEATARKDGSAGLQNPRAGAGRTGGARNFHPTVKPVELMRWLVRLVTPINGTVIDPFLGSGTTGMACRYELRNFIGIEREAEYIQIAERRIASVAPLFASEQSA